MNYICMLMFEGTDMKMWMRMGVFMLMRSFPFAGSPDFLQRLSDTSKGDRGADPVNEAG